ncbi:unnamed protein product [Mycena citricolor]|uniref:Uncharacterized protein n=1 Tax=Mycena citricolor TaxID=2018698 RepID=A0AAD2GYY8_9AGAR|nr:unnamed protein product [Mycena citricolor]
MGAERKAYVLAALYQATTADIDNYKRSLHECDKSLNCFPSSNPISWVNPAKYSKYLERKDQEELEGVYCQPSAEQGPDPEVMCKRASQQQMVEEVMDADNLPSWHIHSPNLPSTFPSITATDVPPNPVTWNSKHWKRPQNDGKYLISTKESVDQLVNWDYKDVPAHFPPALHNTGYIINFRNHPLAFEKNMGSDTLQGFDRLVKLMVSFLLHVFVQCSCGLAQDHDSWSSGTNGSASRTTRVLLPGQSTPIPMRRSDHKCSGALVCSFFQTDHLANDQHREADLSRTLHIHNLELEQ